MTKVSYLFLLSLAFFSACTEPFKKAKADGTEYKIISGGGKLVSAGNVLEMSLVVKYKDSVLYSTFESGMPEYAPYDTSKYPPLYKEIFKRVHQGDSIMIRTSTDTLIKMGQAAPFMKKGEYIMQGYRIAKVYTTQTEADRAKAAASVVAEARAKVKGAEQAKKDEVILQDYFKKHNIKTVKAPMGTYVEILQEGTGPNADTSNILSVNYTGRTIDGKMFDSNTDSSKKHVEPLYANLTNDRSVGIGGVIKGWSDGLGLLNKGAKARIYIPSALAYGPSSKGEDIKPNSILMFDIDVLDIYNRAQFKEVMKARNEVFRAKQKVMMDSLAKASKLKNDTTKKM